VTERRRRGLQTAAAVGAALVVVLLGALGCRGAPPTLDEGEEPRRLQEARQMLEEGDAEGAARLLHDVLGSAQSAEAHYLLGNAYAELQRYQAAADAYQRALGIDDKHVDARANLAVALYHLQRHQEARDALEDALRLQPEDADLHYNLGGVLVALGELDRAEEAFLRAGELDPLLVETLLGLGTLYHLQGRYHAAAEALRSYLALATDPLWRAEAQRMLTEAEYMLAQGEGMPAEHERVAP